MLVLKTADSFAAAWRQLLKDRHDEGGRQGTKEILLRPKYWRTRKFGGLKSWGNQIARWAKQLRGQKIQQRGILFANLKILNETREEQH